MMNNPTVRQMMRIWKARARTSQREGGEEPARIGEFILARIPRSLPSVTGVCSYEGWEGYLLWSSETAVGRWLAVLFLERDRFDLIRDLWDVRGLPIEVALSDATVGDGDGTSVTMADGVRETNAPLQISTSGYSVTNSDGHK